MTTLPLSPAPSEANIKSITQSYFTQSHSQKVQVRSSLAQRWGVFFKWNPATLSKRNFLNLFMVLCGLNGRYGTCTSVIPGHELAEGAWGATPLVKGAHSKGDSTIDIDGLLPSQSSACMAGDFFKFSSHTKVYVIQATSSSNPSGESTITIYPPLLEDLADNTGITYDNVPFTLGLVNDVTEASIESALRYGVEVEFMERY
jgi:hypothetical protein